jgi:hypothetical protein
MFVSVAEKDSRQKRASREDMVPSATKSQKSI